MQVIKNLFLFLSIIFLFSSCASLNNFTKYTKQKKELVFYKDKELLSSLIFSNPKQEYYHFPICVKESFVINDLNKNYGKIFFEYIDLDSQCTWTGLANSFFETSLNYELKLKSLEVIEKFDIGSYTFKTYKIDNKTYLNAIYIYSTFSNIFLLDYDGKLYTKLLRKLKPNYENKFLNKNRYKGNYNSSLVRKNIIEHYFKYENIRF